MSDVIERAIQTALKNIQSTIQVTIDNIQQQVSMKISSQHYIQIITQWKSLKIRFFYSDMSMSWRWDDIVNKENKIYYQSVIVFISWLRVAAATCNSAKIHQNLNTCFHAKAEQWWTHKLDKVICPDLIAHHHDVEQWCKALEKRFKTSFNQVLIKLNTIRYIIDDVHAQKSFTAYVITIITAVKNCDQEKTEYTQVFHTWNHMNIFLKITIDESFQDITIAQFMKTIYQK